MTRVSSIFSQILQLIPRFEFESAVRKHDAERHARGFSSWGQFIAMLFCQLGHAKSLREICGGLAASEPGERPGPLDRIPGRHHPQLEPPVVRARLGESLDPAEDLADVRREGGGQFLSMKLFGNARGVEVFERAAFRGQLVRLGRDESNLRRIRAGWSGSVGDAIGSFRVN